MPIILKQLLLLFTKIGRTCKIRPDFHADFVLDDNGEESANIKYNAKSDGRKESRSPLDDMYTPKQPVL